jgi:hypothetical protein
MPARAAEPPGLGCLEACGPARRAPADPLWAGRAGVPPPPFLGSQPAAAGGPGPQRCCSTGLPAHACLDRYAWILEAGFKLPTMWAPYYGASGGSIQMLGQYYGLPVLSLRSAAYHLMLRNVSGYVVRWLRAPRRAWCTRPPPLLLHVSGNCMPIRTYFACTRLPTQALVLTAPACAAAHWDKRKRRGIRQGACRRLLLLRHCESRRCTLPAFPPARLPAWMRAAHW